jgi:DNA (cytosine-5)-methyltransferase 1
LVGLFGGFLRGWRIMNELALFAGAGGGILGGHLLGWRTVCAVEWDAYAASVLVARQNDGTLPPFPIWDDVQTFDGRPWRGRVDVVSGGFPCQDISAAGKGAGITGERSGMWKHMARIIHEVRPRFCFVENSPMLTSRGLGSVLGDLAEMGFNAEWCVLGFNRIGGHIRRERIWIVAESGLHRQHNKLNESLENTTNMGIDYKPENQNTWDVFGIDWQRKGAKYSKSPTSKPLLCREIDGVAGTVDRIKCLGNGQVPAVAATAFRILSDRME